MEGRSNKLVVLMDLTCKNIGRVQIGANLILDYEKVSHCPSQGGLEL